MKVQFTQGKEMDRGWGGCQDSEGGKAQRVEKNARKGKRDTVLGLAKKMMDEDIMSRCQMGQSMEINQSTARIS